MRTGSDGKLRVNFKGKEFELKEFIETFLWIVDKDMKARKLKLNGGQRKLLETVERLRREGKPVRVDVLKARQIGYSTLIAAINFTEWLTRPYARIAVIADVKDHAANIFRMYRTFYDNLNRFWGEETKAKIEGSKERDGRDLRPELGMTRAGQTMVNAENGASLEVVVEGEGAGRSGTYLSVHLSECAFFHDLRGTMNAVSNAVSLKNPESMIFLETTANGFEGFKEKWDVDVASPEGVYVPVFTPWFSNPDYSLPLPPKGLPKLEAWLYEKLKAHPEVKDGQAMWYWAKYLEGGKERDLLLQEYPWDPTDAFVSTGGSVFDADAIARRKNEVSKDRTKEHYGGFSCRWEWSPDGASIAVSDISFSEEAGGAVRILEDPIPGHPYVVTIDPNMGGDDDAAIVCRDNSTLRQVAVLRDKKIPPDALARQAYCMGMWYNGALVSSETNVVQIVEDYLVKAKYPRLYMAQESVVSDANMRISSSFGHRTTPANRQFMIDSERVSFRENPSTVTDYETLDQMEGFQLRRRTADGPLKAQAASGYHDDLVMALCAFWLVRTQISSVPSPEYRGIKDAFKGERIEVSRDAERKRRESLVNPARWIFG